MTMDNAIMDRLTDRGLDVELADRLGWASVKRGDGEHALVIPFYRRGKIVRRKYRWFDRTEKRWSQDKGGVKCVWNEDCLLEERLRGQPLVVTEGELDALAAVQCGLERTVSVPDGAPPPGDRSVEELEASRKYSWLHDIAPLVHKDNVPEIILAVDGDENGAALLQDLSIQLGRYRCKFVTYPFAKDPERRGRERLKDLNEVLEDYGPKGVVETVAKAQWLKVDGVYRMSELPPLPAARIYETGVDAFGDHCKSRLGDFSVWTGTPMSGKTTLIQDIANRAAEREGLKTAWASFEQAPQRDHRRALREWYCRAREYSLPAQARADADAWVDRHHVFLVPSETDDVTIDWLMEKMEVAVVRHGVGLIVVDPWNEMDHFYDGRQMREDQYINSAIKTIRRFARAFQVHVAIVAHPTKQEKDINGKFRVPTLYDIHGGAVWYNKADLGIVVHRVSDTDTQVKTAKSRYHDMIGRPGSVVMQYCGENRRFTEIERLNRIDPAPNAPPVRDLLDPDVPLFDSPSEFE